MHFENEITCTSDVTFINIGIAFWEQGAKLKFFGKVQKGKQDILVVLKNMAWDIFHWTQTTLNFDVEPKKKANINIPLFYSVDSRFLELSKIIRLKAIAFDRNTRVTYPYETDRLSEYLSNEEARVYFNPQTLHARNQKRGYVDTEKISKELELELISRGIF